MLVIDHKTDARICSNLIDETLLRSSLQMAAIGRDDEVDIRIGGVAQNTADTVLNKLQFERSRDDDRHLRRVRRWRIFELIELVRDRPYRRRDTAAIEMLLYGARAG